MDLVFKFFLWKVKIKTQKLGSEEKAKYLANELFKAVQDCGYIVENRSIQKGFCSLNINVHWHGTEKATLSILNSYDGWLIETKPNFKLLEEKK